MSRWVGRRVGRAATPHLEGELTERGVGSGRPSAPTPRERAFRGCRPKRGVGSGPPSAPTPIDATVHEGVGVMGGSARGKTSAPTLLGTHIYWKSVEVKKASTNKQANKSSNKTKGSRSNESTTRWTKRGAAERSRSSRVELVQAAPQILVGSGRAQFWSSRVVSGCRVTAGAQHENCDSGSYGCRIEVP